MFLHSVVHHTIVRHFLVFGAWTAIVGVGVDADASAWGEDAGDLDVLGVHQADEVLHDDVDAVLVEVAMIAEGEEVELEGFALHHALVGQVGNVDFGKVGLSRDGAQGGELGAVELHPVVVLGVLVLEGLQHFGSVVLTIFSLFAKGGKPFLFALVVHDFLIFR